MHLLCLRACAAATCEQAEGALCFDPRCSKWIMSAVEGVDAFAQDDSEVQLLLAPLSEARARSLVSSADGSLQRFACHISHP